MEKREWGVLANIIELFPTIRTALFTAFFAGKPMFFIFK
jgi:hypothetical protein